MAVGSIGGREYYTDMRALTSGTTNCKAGAVKGLFSTSTSITMHFSSGNFVKIAPTANDILPFSPVGVTFASGSVYALY